MAQVRSTVTDAARTLRVAIAFFGALSWLAWQSGVFDQVGPEVTAALVVFALGFAALTLACDREMRDYLRGMLTGGRGRFRSAEPKSPAAKRAAS
jgi:hypothetical protein